MLAIRLVPDEPPVADARYLAAAERRHEWAASWVRRWTFRQRCQQLAGAFGMLGAAGMAAAGQAMAFAMAAEAADVRDAELTAEANEEVAALWARA